MTTGQKPNCIDLLRTPYKILMLHQNKILTSSLYSLSFGSLSRSQQRWTTWGRKAIGEPEEHKRQKGRQDR
jgi:hypothetical protein